MSDTAALLREYDAAAATRREVCGGDCAWPVGDGTCPSCAKEQRSLHDLLEALRSAEVPRVWPSADQFEADAATVAAAAVMGVEGVSFVAPDEEYAERVYGRAERILRRLGLVA